MKYTIILFMLIAPFFGYGQNLDSTNTEVLDSNKTEELIIEHDTVDGEIYTIVDSMPLFPGGMQELMMFLAHNIYYPSEAKDNDIQGKIYVNFVVGKDGKIRDAKILRGVHKLLDDEALRVVNMMPNWKPGTQRGKKVAVSYNLPISFKLGIHNLPVSAGEKSFKSGVKFHEKGKYEMAIKYYTLAIKRDPKHENAYYNRGLCYHKLNEKELACINWGLAKDLGAKDAETLINKYCTE